MPDVVKVTLNNETLIDISDSTVDSSKVLSSYVGYEGDGDRFVGAYTPPASVTVEPLSVTSNGTYTASSGSAYSPVTVNVPTGGGSSSTSGVKFIDYDGTVLHEYTVEEFSELSALPANPTHTGLTSQGWNWTKAEIDSQLEYCPQMSVIVGQMYITDDGKTRVYCHFEEGRTSPYVGLGVNGTVTIDWGDGSNIETLTGSSLTTIVYSSQHNYSNPGDYVILITASSGEYSIVGPSTGTDLITNKGTTSNIKAVYNCSIRRVEIGANVKAGYRAFYYCRNLETVTIPTTFTLANDAFSYCSQLKAIVGTPNTVTNLYNTVANGTSGLKMFSIPSNASGTIALTRSYFMKELTIPENITTLILSYMYSFSSPIVIPRNVTSISFSNCDNLASSISIPNTVTTLGSSAFAQCLSLRSINLPDSITRINNAAFNQCQALISINIPSGVTRIDSSTFYQCYALSSLTIPANVTNIATQAFYQCYGMKEYHFLSTTPPTLAGTNAFTNIPSDCIIYVPAESLEAYKTATNWSTYASYMQGE